MQLKNKEARIMMDQEGEKHDVDASAEEREENSIVRKSPSSHSVKENDYKIDDLFQHICRFCLMIGVNFYRDRDARWRCLSLAMVIFVCSTNIYFIAYVVYRTILKPFDPERVAAAISISTWVLQATLSTIFLAYWQYTNQPSKIIKLLYAANKLVRWNVLSLEKSCFYSDERRLLFRTCCDRPTRCRYWSMDADIQHIFGDRRLLVIVQLTSMYTLFCWAVAFFIFSLLVHSANAEFIYFNEQVRSSVFLLLPITLVKLRSNMDQGDHDAQTDEALCNYIQKLMRIYSRLTECVKKIDKMFSCYAFVMFSTITPTTLFALYVILRNPSSAFIWERLINWPLVLFCLFSFFSLVNAPSRLHDTIGNTKSALCSNTHIWFPYRPNVYVSALAFIAHLDQSNLGVSLWGFFVISKELVLTTLSVMATGLAMFLELRSQ